MSDDTLSGQLTQRTTWARESRDCYLSMTPQELARLAGMARRLEADLAAARAEVEALRARKPSLPDKLERRLCEVAEGDDESPEGYRIAVQVARDLLAALDAPAPGSAGGDVFCPELARLTARAEVAEGRVARLSEQREGHRLRLARGVNRDALRQLSDAWGAWHAWANANSDPEHLLGWGNRLCEMAAVVLSNLGYHNDRALAAAVGEVRDE